MPCKARLWWYKFSFVCPILAIPWHAPLQWSHFLSVTHLCYRTLNLAICPVCFTFNFADADFVFSGHSFRLSSLSSLHCCPSHFSLTSHLQCSSPLQGSESLFSDFSNFESLAIDFSFVSLSGFCVYFISSPTAFYIKLGWHSFARNHKPFAVTHLAKHEICVPTHRLLPAPKHRKNNTAAQIGISTLCIQDLKLQLDSSLSILLGREDALNCTY